MFHGACQVDAVPRAFPFDGDMDVVVSVPRGTTKLHRAALLGAFLAAGFPVKDAGEFNVASFHVNDRPWWYDRDGFQRTKLPEGVEIDDLADLPVQEYDGLTGMEIALDDPTSLWAPDLLANQNLKSDYFLRLFEMRFDDTEIPVRLRNLVEAEELEAYREAVAKVNKRVAAHNDRVEEYEANRSRYSTDFADYVKRYEKWDRDQSRKLKRKQKAFEKTWLDWKTANADVIEARDQAGIAEASWKRSSPEVPDFELPGTEVEAALPRVTKADLYDSAAVDAMEGEGTIVSVPCRRLSLLAEVIDAKTGHVVWVGGALAVAQKGTTDTVLLRDTIRQVTQKP